MFQLYNTIWEIFIFILVFDEEHNLGNLLIISLFPSLLPMLQGHFKMREVPVWDTYDMGAGTPHGHFKIMKNLWKVEESDTQTHAHT